MIKSGIFIAKVTAPIGHPNKCCRTTASPLTPPGAILLGAKNRSRDKLTSNVPIVTHKKSIIIFLAEIFIKAFPLSYNFSFV
jgi:hypothetical protein